MGKQYDKVIKRRRRLAYLERRKEKARDAAAAAAKPKLRKPKPKAAAVEESPARKTREKATPLTELADGAAEITASNPVVAESPIEEPATAPAE